jgi:hypothetical protein
MPKANGAMTVIDPSEALAANFAAMYNRGYFFGASNSGKVEKDNGRHKLWLRTEVGFAGGKIDRHRDVLVNDQPFAAGLAQNISAAHGNVHWVTMFAFAG